MHEIDATLAERGVDVRRHLAAGAERRIETPVGAVAGNAKVVKPGEGTLHGAGRDDVAVGLQRDGEGLVGAPGEISRHLATGSERRVEAAIRVVAGNGEVGPGPGPRPSGHHDLAVR